MKLLLYSIGIFFCATLFSSSQGLFPLSDSDPDSPEFRRKFMASYGVNAAIEPKLTQEDRPLQEAIIPNIKSNPRAAIQTIEASLKPDTNPAFFNILGSLYYQINDYKSAEFYLKKSLEEFPSLRRSWRTLALCYVQRDMLQSSISPLLKVIELGGGDAQSYGLLAYAYLNEQKYESALSAYRMARMFEPDSLDFRRGQALCLMETQQNPAAIALFDELISERPNESSFWLAQSNAFLSSDRVNNAIANLQILADTNQSNWDSLIMLGDLYLNQNVHQLALNNYLTAFRQHQPSDYSKAIRPLRNLVGRRLFAEAKIYYNAIEPGLGNSLSDDQKRDVQVSLAQIEMHTGNPEKAFSTLKSIVEQDPLDGASLLLLGEYHLEKKSYEDAEYYFERATSVIDFAPEAYIALGRLFVLRGQLIEALKPLRKAQQLKPSPGLQRYVQSIERALDLRQ